MLTFSKLYKACLAKVPEIVEELLENEHKCDISFIACAHLGYFDILKLHVKYNNYDTISIEKSLSLILSNDVQLVRHFAGEHDEYDFTEIVEYLVELGGSHINVENVLGGIRAKPNSVLIEKFKKMLGT